MSFTVGPAVGSACFYAISVEKCEFVWYLVNVSLTAQTILFNTIKNSPNHAQTIQNHPGPLTFDQKGSIIIS